MDIVGQILLLIVSLLVLGKSAETVVKSLVKVAHILSWSRFIVAFIILGIATSTPEFFVGINSAIDGNPQLSLGNILGATIVLLALVTGGTAYFSGRVVLSAWFSKKEVFLMSGVILLPIVLLYDMTLSRLDAIIIILAYAFYLYIIYFNSQKRFNHQNHEVKTETPEHKLEKTALFLILGFLGIFISSRLAVNSAIYLGSALKIQVLILGILVFSIGTNLPELVLTLTALREKQKTILVGNILGSATTNSLVLAVTSLIRPIEILDVETFVVGVIFFVATVITFSFIIKSKDDVSKNEGLVLFGIYVLFVFIQIATKLF